MSVLENDDSTVLQRHQKSLCHLRERKASDRIAIFIGAGVSKELNFPNWKELIERIERDPEFDAYTAPRDNSSLTFRTQALIQHLKKIATPDSFQIDATAERVAKHKWISIVHRCLYKESVADDHLCDHPYLGSFLPVIKDSPLTINYNFDDSIERMLAKTFASEQAELNEKVYETVWDPSTQYQRSKGVIYHPNGFLPKKLIDGYSNNIVFAEGEFADQLIQSMHGHYSTLISHLSRYTSLLIGLSLDDPTLKHLLRQNVHLNPGHVHYWLKYCNELPSQSEMEEEREINFELYGIITIHLTPEEFPVFGRLLACSDDVYAEAADRCGVVEQFVYYVTGAVGAGKSSVVQKMKSLSWIGEWVDPRPENLAKPHIELTEKERKQVDDWVSNQFRKKDFKMSGLKGGVVISDRSPLDPLAFTTDIDRTIRASEHLKELAPSPLSRRLTRGHVIFLTATAGELLSRAKHRHLDANEDYLAAQQETLKNIYDVPNLKVSVVSTCGRTLSQVVRNVTREIHLGEYDNYDIHNRIEQLATGAKNEV